jgi:hypothetical protein
MNKRPTDRTSARATKTKLSPAMSLFGNIAMFVITAVICFGLMRGFRGWIANAGEPAGYVLTTTRPVQSGEHLSSANAQWAPIKGKKPAGVVIAPDKRAPIDGYVAIIRLAADKPVKLNLVSKEQSAVVVSRANLTGFVLSQEDLGALAPFLKSGDRVDIIAIKGGGKSADGAEPLSVATVVSSAEVSGLIKPVSVGRAGRQGAAVIAVTSEQARILGLLRQVAKLEVVISPARPREANGIVYPFIPWESAQELGIGHSQPDPEFSQSVPAPPPPPVSGRVAMGEDPERSQVTVAVITPSGTTQAVVPN